MAGMSGRGCLKLPLGWSRSVVREGVGTGREASRDESLALGVAPSPGGQDDWSGAVLTFAERVLQLACKCRLAHMMLFAAGGGGSAGQAAAGWVSYRVQTHLGGGRTQGL